MVDNRSVANDKRYQSIDYINNEIESHRNKNKLFKVVLPQIESTFSIRNNIPYIIHRKNSHKENDHER